MCRIVVTGATGNVGAETVRCLVQRGVRPVAALRSPQRAPESLTSLADIVAADFTDSRSWDAAFEGTQKLFLMRPPAISDARKFIAPVVDRARVHGVQHIVFLSVQGADTNRHIPHHAIEQIILESGIPHTFLRPSFFMQNLSTTHREEIRDRNELFVPAGRGKTSFIDVRDIAAVAAMVLTEPGHEGRSYELTSNDALDYFEVAAMLSEELGRPITYRKPGALPFILRKLREGNPLPYVFVVTALYTVARMGRAGRLTGDTARLLGRPAIGMRQFIRDSRECWTQRRGASSEQ